MLTPQGAPLALGPPALLLCVSGTSVLGLILVSVSSPPRPPNGPQSPFSSQVGERVSADSKGHSWEIFSQGSGRFNTQACANLAVPGMEPGTSHRPPELASLGPVASF